MERFPAIGLTDLPSPFDGLKVLGELDPAEAPRAFTDAEVLTLFPRLQANPQPALRRTSLNTSRWL